MEITKDNYRKLNGLHELLKYVKDCLSEDIKKLPNQDYIDPEILTDKIERLGKDLEAYQKKLKEDAPYIFDGNILRIDITDAISFTTYKYYKILDSKNFSKNNFIICDTLEVTLGDYETSISYKNHENIDVQSLISEYLTFYHQDGEDIKIQYENYKKFLDNLQPPK